MMRRGTIGVVVVLSVISFLPGLCAQQGAESLGDVARRERERKKAQPKPTKTLTNENATAGGENLRSLKQLMDEQPRPGLKILAVRQSRSLRRLSLKASPPAHRPAKAY